MLFILGGIIVKKIIDIANTCMDWRMNKLWCLLSSNTTLKSIYATAAMFKKNPTALGTPKCV
jgi:hypothetical protein